MPTKNSSGEAETPKNSKPRKIYVNPWQAHSQVEEHSSQLWLHLLNSSPEQGIAGELCQREPGATECWIIISHNCKYDITAPSIFIFTPPHPLDLLPLTRLILMPVTTLFTYATWVWEMTYPNPYAIQSNSLIFVVHTPYMWPAVLPHCLLLWQLYLLGRAKMQ